ncbi:hydrogen peroxide-dependent heme synthase [Bryobacter aggregatus]|uniref:hydrogen peroxide-dependent heme synthase n=1 Tax=Bryobacter aggregatus TaxID=360054 RepID=UPI0004E163BB|nr:hydrogen peroxide-dependent heme synthase [Bryobacter aggregatus]
MSFPLPPLPLTLEGSAVLHQMFQISWSAWRGLTQETRNELIDELTSTLEGMGAGTGLFSMFGHKADFMLVHFRAGFEELGETEWAIRKLRIWDYCQQTSSYVSIVELGLYESTAKVYGGLLEKGIAPNGPGWKEGVAETIERQKVAMAPRIYPEIPPFQYCCFYPMDRLRGEAKNWYMLPLEERARLMHEHGMIGRRYAGEVKQIISGSIGFDDWEWGVDLFSDDALVFKKLIYEMRFDPVSAIYAKFGTFYLGIRCNHERLKTLLTI